MNFGLAVEAMKLNMRVARWSWDHVAEKYLFLADSQALNTDADLSEFEDKTITATRILVQRTENETLLMGYQPSIEDLLADDWYIVDMLNPDGERTELPI